VRRFDFASLLKPARFALFATAALLCIYALEWREGRLAQLPLEPMSVANSLAAGTGFANPFWQPSGPTAWVTPAIPFVFAGALMADKWTTIRAFYFIVGFGVLCIMAAIYLVLRFCIPRWSAPARGLFVAAFLGYCLLDGNVLTYPGSLTSAESALLLAGLALMWRKPGSAGASFMLFVSGTLLALTHPGLALAGITATGVLSVVVWRRASGRSVGLLRSGALAAAAAVIVGAGPWAIRNRVVFHEWIAAKSNGCFELVLAHEQTSDGILTESSLLSGNPSTNLRVFTEYRRLGEREFLAGYRQRAREIVTRDLGRYLVYSRNRLFNALCFSKAPGDTDLVLPHLDPTVAGRLVGRGLVLFYGVNPTTFLWPRADLTESAERASLASAGVTNLDAFMADWARAQHNIRHKNYGAAAILVGLLWSGIPSACCLGVILLGGGRAPRLIPAAAALYLVALLPNIMITHDLRHQCDFEVLFALFLSAPVEVFLRWRAARAPHATRQVETSDAVVG
jgi:hypothetical protein